MTNPQLCRKAAIHAVRNLIHQDDGSDWFSEQQAALIEMCSQMDYDDLADLLMTHMRMREAKE